MLNQGPFERFYAKNKNLKRKRVSVACIPCRAQKIRCDGGRPQCETCLRRRESCSYLGETNRDADRNASVEAGRGHAPDVSGYPDTEPGMNQSMLAASPSQNDGRSHVTAMGLMSHPLSDSPDREKGFFGESSAIAFIKNLQERLDSGVATTESEWTLSQNQSCRSTRTGGFQWPSIPLDLLPPRSLADHLVDCYLSKIHTLYPFVHKEAFLAAYHSLWKTKPSQNSVEPNTGLGLGDMAVNPTTFYYGLNMVFALGCHFSDTIQEQRDSISEAFFHRCKPALDLDNLESGDLALVQTFLLMAHYLQGSRAPNRCWHVIGTACRLAQAVGLHSTVGDERRSFGQVQIRRRVWHGCVMLDLAISTILGRPVMISHTTVPLPEAVDDVNLSDGTENTGQQSCVFSRVQWFVATLKLYDILRKTLNTLYNDDSEQRTGKSTDQKRHEKLLQIRGVTEIDGELQDLCYSFPQPLQWAQNIPEEGLDDFRREKALLRARYLYLKILIYRPVLSQWLRDAQRPPETEQDSFTTKPLENGFYGTFVKDCSILCVQFASDLIQLVNETCGTNLASVWFYNVFYLFTAASITILAEGNQDILNIIPRQNLEDSWNKCQSTLEYLKSYSSVAERSAQSLGAIRSKCLIESNDCNPGTSSANELNILSNEWGPQTDTENVEDIPALPDDFFLDFDIDQTIFDPLWFNIRF